VRWDALFADLEGQLDAALGDDVAELVRAEVARTELGDRLRAHVGAPLALALLDGQWVRGVVLQAAPQWVLLAEGEAVGGPAAPGPVATGSGGQVLVPLAALERVTGLTRSVAAPTGQVARRLGLGAALRGLSRDRAAVVLELRGARVSGTIDRVAADHLDLAVHPVGEQRRPEAVTEVVAVPFAAVLAVRSAPR